MSKRIVVVGSVNTDMVVKGKRIPVPGETVTGGTFVLAGGGKGANQAVAAVRLGADVALVAKVGDDMFGRQSLEGFQNERIDVTGVMIDPQHATGVALILVDEKGENAISVASGANHAVTPEEVETALRGAGSVGVVLLQLELPLATVARAAAVGRELGATVILDPAPAVPLDAELLATVDILTPNESEARILTGIDVADEATARRAAERLLAAGTRCVIVTLGGQGALLADGDGMTMLPCRRVEPQDTTAAGDAFNGGLAYELARGLPLRQAVETALLVGTLAVTKMGAQPSLPTRAELKEFCKK